jgi:hypothetical protein
VFGKESDHYQRFAALYPKLSRRAGTHEALGILKAAKVDYENGYLFQVRSLIEAEVFDDFLDQANYLLQSGYIGPAAVLAGSVLEDGLRRLCIRGQITLPPRPTIEPMNVELAKAGVYNALVKQKITALGALRNRAAHGKWDEFTKPDVEQMLSQVRDFMERCVV